MFHTSQRFNSINSWAKPCWTFLKQYTFYIWSQQQEVMHRIFTHTHTHTHTHTNTHTHTHTQHTHTQATIPVFVCFSCQQQLSFHQVTLPHLLALETPPFQSLACQMPIWRPHSGWKLEFCGCRCQQQRHPQPGWHKDPWDNWNLLLLSLWHQVGTAVCLVCDNKVKQC